MNLKEINSNSGLILLAFLFLVAGNLFATLVDVVVKALASNVSIFQYLFFRQISVILFLLPFWLNLEKEKRHPGSLKVHSFRALMTNIGAPAAVVALLYLPLATANVIFYTAPMITLLLAALIFNEKLTLSRIASTSLGLLGVILAVRPDQLGIAALLALCTAIAIAFYNISVKWLPQSSSTINTIFWSNLLALPLIMILAGLDWQPITSDLLLLSITSCLFIILYQGCCIIAFKKSDASAIAVAEYSGLVFAAILGWLIFEEVINGWTSIGIGLIILPIIWQTVFESRN